MALSGFGLMVLLLSACKKSVALKNAQINIDFMIAIFGYIYDEGKKGKLGGQQEQQVWGGQGFEYTRGPQ
jgi:hypothetical protein